MRADYPVASAEFLTETVARSAESAAQSNLRTGLSVGARNVDQERRGIEALSVRRLRAASDGRVWTLSGATERARIEFSADGRTQTIVWEWKPGDRGLRLCDRVARRID